MMDTASDANRLKDEPSSDMVRHSVPLVEITNAFVPAGGSGGSGGSNSTSNGAGAGAGLNLIKPQARTRFGKASSKPSSRPGSRPGSFKSKAESGRWRAAVSDDDGEDNDVTEVGGENGRFLKVSPHCLFSCRANRGLFFHTPVSPTQHGEAVARQRSEFFSEI
jgi:hypothetical protein